MTSAEQSRWQPDGLHVIMSPDWRQLTTDAINHLVEHPCEDVFDTQQVLCRGTFTSRAITQRFALAVSDRSDGGITAGVHFDTITGWRRSVESELLGIDHGSDPWRHRNLALVLLEVFDDADADSWFRPLRRYLTSVDLSLRPGRRLSLADRIAGLLLAYCDTHPVMMSAWSAGQSVAADGGELADSRQWQFSLWAELLRRLPKGSDPGSRHLELVAAIGSASPRQLGDTVRVVDPPPMRHQDRELLAAAAMVIPVRCWLHLPAGDGNEPSRLAVRLGQTSLESVTGWLQLASRIEHLDDVERDPTLLVRLQRQLSTPANENDTAKANDTGSMDQSVQVHFTHGPDRQVEVLRDLLCGLLSDRPELEPRDIVVAVANLQEFAPHLRSAFNLDPDEVAAPLHPGHLLRVQLAATSLEQHNRVLELMQWILALPARRASVEELLQLCAFPPVVERFHLHGDSQDRLRRLISDAGVRWGVDGQQRAMAGLADVAQGTWFTGVQRILTSIALAPEPPGWLGPSLPIAQMESTDVQVAGALAEIVSRVRRSLLAFQIEAPIVDWIARLRTVLEDLAATSAEDSWQLHRAHAALADLEELTADRSAALSLGDVRALFSSLLRTSRGRPNHGNGSLICCDLSDLDNVRHKVVVLMGVDDQRFPAAPTLDGDDLRVSGPKPEHDPRALSRQRLLNGIQAADDTLALIVQSRDPRTNQTVFAAPVVDDLLGVVRGLGTPLEVQHSIHAHSALNFRALNFRALNFSAANYAKTAAPEPFSFDRAALAGAMALSAAERTPRPAATVRARAVTPSTTGNEEIPATEEIQGPRIVDVEELNRFLQDPAKVFVTHQIGVSLARWTDEIDPQLPLELDGLGRWAIGDRWLRARLDGEDPQRLRHAERLSGSTPHGMLAESAMNQISNTVERMVTALQPHRNQPAKHLPIRLGLPSGRRLDGHLQHHGAAIVHCSYSKINGTALNAAWLDLLAVSASGTAPPAGSRWHAVVAGSDDVIRLDAPSVAQATQLLDELVELRLAGLRKVVPFPIKVAAPHRSLTPITPNRWYPGPDEEAKQSWTATCGKSADWAVLGFTSYEDLRARQALPSDPGVPAGSRFESLAHWWCEPIRDHLTKLEP